MQFFFCFLKKLKKFIRINSKFKDYNMSQTLGLKHYFLKEIILLFYTFMQRQFINANRKLLRRNSGIINKLSGKLIKSLIKKQINK
jgi:hypothetical protein